MEKLIRDNIPELASKNPENKSIYFYYTANEVAFGKALETKLKEETKEYYKAKTREEKLEELVDIQTVINYLLKYNDISDKEFALAYEKKLEHKGGFDKKYIGAFFDKEKKKK